MAVNYKRFAYVSSLYPKLRVTFDQSLEASLDVSMDAKRSAFVDIISPRYTLVEIKYNKQLPQILSSIIQHDQNVTFSKYSSATEVAYEKTRPRQRYRHDLFKTSDGRTQRVVLVRRFYDKSQKRLCISVKLRLVTFGMNNGPQRVWQTDRKRVKSDNNSQNQEISAKKKYCWKVVMVKVNMFICSRRLVFQPLR